ncbi:MAG: ABC transporter permease [Elusimicrobia bacterium]|nr:ABC transporter permease [Elusimicrobiota bacterium]
MKKLFLQFFLLANNILIKNVVSVFDFFSDNITLFIFSIKSLFSKNKKGKILISNLTKSQIYFTGVQSFLLVSLVALMLGGVTIVQSVTQLSKINAEQFIGKILVLVIVRELGPVFTALIVIGRSASAIATEIGNMSISKEIEAMESMGVDPLRYIMIPRLLGMVISLILLTVYFNMVGIFGGLLVAKITLSTSLNILFNNIISTITYTDMLVSFLKSLGFGIIIATISVYQGFKVKISLTEVPQAATKAVVNSLLGSFIFNSILTVLFYI